MPRQKKSSGTLFGRIETHISLEDVIAKDLAAHVNYPGFSTLYLRHGSRYIGERRYHNILDIATVEAIDKGKGTFTSFIQELRRTYPDMGIYVECVINSRLGELLQRLGFRIKKADHPHAPSSFYWLP